MLLSGKLKNTMHSPKKISDWIDSNLDALVSRFLKVPLEVAKEQIEVKKELFTLFEKELTAEVACYPDSKNPKSIAQVWMKKHAERQLRQNPAFVEKLYKLVTDTQYDLSFLLQHMDLSYQELKNKEQHELIRKQIEDYLIGQSIFIDENDQKQYSANIPLHQNGRQTLHPINLIISSNLPLQTGIYTIKDVLKNTSRSKQAYQVTIEGYRVPNPDDSLLNIDNNSWELIQGAQTINPKRTLYSMYTTSPEQL